MLRTYDCPKCGELSHYRKDTKIIESCPMCHGPITQKYGLNFKLNGQGFYSTDSKREKK